MANRCGDALTGPFPRLLEDIAINLDGNLLQGHGADRTSMATSMQYSLIPFTTARSARLAGYSTAGMTIHSRREDRSTGVLPNAKFGAREACSAGRRPSASALATPLR